MGKKQFLCEFGKINEFLRNHSNWEIYEYQKRMKRGPENKLLALFLYRRLPDPLNTDLMIWIFAIANHPSFIPGSDVLSSW